MVTTQGFRKSVLLTETEARALTDEIRSDLAGVYGKIVTAFRGRAWQALGYTSWSDYCHAEFRGALRLRNDEIQTAVAMLMGEGLSQRAIAAATGISVGKVNKEAPTVRPDKLTGADGRERGSRRLRIVSDETNRDQPEPEPIVTDEMPQHEWAALMVGESGTKGLTYKELSHTAEGWGHPQSSNALSRAHRRGTIKPSGIFRDGCSVYVAIDVPLP